MGTIPIVFPRGSGRLGNAELLPPNPTAASVLEPQDRRAIITVAKYLFIDLSTLYAFTRLILEIMLQGEGAVSMTLTG